MHKILVFGSTGFQAQAEDPLTQFFSFVKPTEMASVVKAKYVGASVVLPAFFDKEEDAREVARTLAHFDQYTTVVPVTPEETQAPYYPVFELGPLFANTPEVL